MSYRHVLDMFPLHFSEHTHVQTHTRERMLQIRALLQQPLIITFQGRL